MGFRLQQFVQRIEFFKIKDFIQIMPMSIAFCVSLFFRLKHNNIWLICERRGEARDNGYWFFRYIIENHPEIEAVYAIDRASVDYNKVASLGKVIQFGSFTHWIYYWSAKRNISSQKEGKPNSALCFLLEVYLGARKNRAYIRHGIAKDRQEWVYYLVTKMNLFACSAYKEYEMVKQFFGYPEDYVKLVGLCRFDNLLAPHEVKRQILVMPTMREWLRVVSSDTMKYENRKTLEDSEFFETWNDMLCCKQLDRLLKKYQIQLFFYPHAAMQRHIHLFKTTSTNVIIGDSAHFDVQQLLMESAMLITDYSSIFFDFAYMQKPLIYYQFDYEKYRKGQYKEGFFSYEKDGFGPIVKTKEELLQSIEDLLDNNLRMPEIYKSRLNGFFAYNDDNNSKRTYEAILGMGK